MDKKEAQLLIDRYYKIECLRKSDISEHLPILLRLLNECSSAYEFGIRGVVSTWAFLKSSVDKITSVDIRSPHDVEGWDHTPRSLLLLHELADALGKEFAFWNQSTLDVEIEETDFLFIDTWHCYDHLKAELDLHASKVKKYIALHDVVMFAHKGESYYGDQTKHYEGMQRAIDEFLEDNPNWEIHEWHTNDPNGLGVLKRND